MSDADDDVPADPHVVAAVLGRTAVVQYVHALLHAQSSDERERVKGVCNATRARVADWQQSESVKQAFRDAFDTEMELMDPYRWSVESAAAAGTEAAERLIAALRVAPDQEAREEAERTALAEINRIKVSDLPLPIQSAWVSGFGETMDRHAASLE